MQKATSSVREARAEAERLLAAAAVVPPDAVAKRFQIVYAAYELLWRSDRSKPKIMHLLNELHGRIVAINPASKVDIEQLFQWVMRTMLPKLKGR